MPLISPGATVVSGQVLIGLQLWIAVRRQHFAVSVDLDAESLGLFEQGVEIVKIVA